MSALSPRPLIQAWRIIAVMDWPPGAAKTRSGPYVGPGIQVMAIFPADSDQEAREDFIRVARKEMRHRFVRIDSCVRVPAAENEAAIYSAEWLERAKYDAIQARRKHHG